MSEAVEQLLVVQDRDVRIRRVERDLDGIPRERQAIDEELEGLRRALGADRDAARAAEVSRKSLEIEVDSMRERIGKYQTQQLQIKSNEEYRALVSEIATLRSRIAAVEDQELQAMERIEELGRRLRETETALREAEREAEERRARVREKEEALGQRLAELRKERLELVDRCDEFLLTQYGRILEKKGDIALVAVENGNCGGCHLRLPPATVNAARGGRGFAVCDHCGRMIYVRN